MGTVILTCWKEVPPAVTLTKMLTGKATKCVGSAFFFGTAIKGGGGAHNTFFFGTTNYTRT